MDDARTVKETMNLLLYPPPKEEVEKASGDILEKSKSFIPRDALFEDADKHQEKFLDVGEMFKVETDEKENFKKWVDSLSVEELASLLRVVPKTFDFGYGKTLEITAWQRILVYCQIFCPFSVTSKISLPLDNMYENKGKGKRSRTSGIDGISSCGVGIGKKVSFLNSPTGSGKTIMSTLCAAIPLTFSAFPKFEQVLTDRRMGMIFSGPAEVKLAPLSILATPPGTFDHFYNHAIAVAAAINSSPGNSLVVWKGMNKNHHSVQIAYDNTEGESFLWVMPIDKVKDVLAEGSDYSIVSVVYDEAVVPVPFCKNSRPMADVICTIYAQATVDSVMKMTDGVSSPLREFFGGAFEHPRRFEWNVTYRNWKNLCLMSSQYTKLMVCMSPSLCLRNALRQSLDDLLPCGISVSRRICRRNTITSLIAGSRSDVVPVRMLDSLLLSLRSFFPDEESVSSIKNLFEDGEEFKVPSISDLTSVLKNIKSKYQTGFSCVERIVSKLEDFSMSNCPICFESKENVSFFACCGFVVCSSCKSMGMSKCFFCRSTEEFVFKDWQRSPSLFMNPKLDDEKSIFDMESEMVHSLKWLTINGYKRTLVFVQTYGAVNSGINLTLSRDFREATDFSFFQVGSFSGQATEFSKFKRFFDDPNDKRNLAIVDVEVSDKSPLRFGTDLNCADSMVILGDITDAAFYQALGRVIRPRVGRDTSIPIKIIKITT
jgi:hypothetical protein